MTQEKIEGKFYPLTPEAARKLGFAKLTAADEKLTDIEAACLPFGVIVKCEEVSK